MWWDKVSFWFEKYILNFVFGIVFLFGILLMLLNSNQFYEGLFYSIIAILAYLNNLIQLNHITWDQIKQTIKFGCLFKK